MDTLVLDDPYCLPIQNIPFLCKYSVEEINEFVHMSTSACVTVSVQKIFILFLKSFKCKILKKEKMTFVPSKTMLFFL